MDDVPILVATSAAEVLFPGGVVVRVVQRDALPPGLAAGSLVAVFCRRERVAADPYRGRMTELHEIGCSARVREIVDADDITVVIEGHGRVRIAELTRESPFLAARIEFVPERDNEDEETVVRASIARSLSLGIVELMPELPAEAYGMIETVQGAGALSDMLAANVDIELDEKVAFLATPDVKQRLVRLVPLLARQLEIVEMRVRVTEKIKAELARSSAPPVDRRAMLALQRRFLVEDVESHTIARGPAPTGSLRGMLRRLTGERPLRERLEAEVEEMRATERPNVRKLQIEAIDAEATSLE
jgi:ATP-dependent Lon protease